VPSFAADQVSGPTSIVGTANFYFTVTLPDGARGHVVVGVGDATQGDEAGRRERVAAALNFQVEHSSYDEVVAVLTSGEALPISLTGF
jgi:hypothetical protein